MRLALSFLFLCLALWRCVNAPYKNQTVGTGNEELLLSPEQLLPSGSHLPTVVCCWRRSSHLRPLSRYPPGVVPNCYWLLLVAGDIPPNPGPVRYPCTECGKPVRSNQQGIFCDSCEMWTHTRCCGVSKEAYERLSQEQSEWFCLRCSMSGLPFANSSLNSSLDSNDTVSSQEEETNDFQSCLAGVRSSSAMVFCHLNIQSLLPKMDECQQFFQDTGKTLPLMHIWNVGDVVD